MSTRYCESCRSAPPHDPTGRGGPIWSLLAAPLLAFALALPGSAAGASIVVNSLADIAPPTTNGECTLREAMENADNDAQTHPDCATGSGDDTITFSVSGTIELKDNLPGVGVIDDRLLIIDGGGGITISGEDAHRPFTIFPEGYLDLRNLTITRGETTGDGGGIRNNGGLVALQSVTMSYNHAPDYGGAIYNTGEIEIKESTLVRNEAGRGGALYSSDDVRIDRSTLTENSAEHTGGGILAVGLGRVNTT